MARVADMIAFFGPDLARFGILAVAAAAVATLTFVLYRRWIRAVLESMGTEGSLEGFTAIVLVLASVMSLALLAGVQILASLGFAFGVGIGPAHAAFATVAALVVGYFAAASLCSQAPLKVWILTASVTALAVAVSVLVAGMFYDVSWDGNATYQQAVLKLASGWNPMRTMSALPPTAGADFWSQVYAKGSWLCAASLFAVTHRLEQAKAVHILLIGVNFALAAGLLVTLVPHAWRRALLLAALIALNPITMVQGFTFMYDGEVASLLFAWLLLAGLLWTQLGRWPVLVGLAATTLMLATIKFTALVYVALFLMALVVAAALKPPPFLKPWAAALTLTATLAIGVLFVGYSPYVTNTLQRGSPFYPTVGRGSLNLMVKHMPGNFAGKDRVTKLLLSVFSTPAEAAGPEMSSTLKFPLALTLAELRPFAGSTTRVSGMGPWFGAAVIFGLLTAVLLAVDWRHARDAWILCLVVAEAVVVVTVLANPESWWARYSPQMWLIPLMPAAVAMYRGRGWTRRLGYFVATLLLANALLVAGVNFVSQVYATMRVTKALEAARSWNVPVRIRQNEFTTTWVKFEELGIPYRTIADDEQPPNGVRVPYLDSVIYAGD